MTPSITQQNVFEKLQPLVISVTGLASNLVVQSMANRVSLPPPVPGFVEMTITRAPRLATNYDSWDTANPDPTTLSIEQSTELRIQLDCYGPSSGDWAVMLEAVLRDEYACTALAPTCAPLYAETPIQAPLTDEEAQYEHRWIVGAILQYNPVLSVPMQFADAASVDLVNVDEAYPP